MVDALLRTETGWRTTKLQRERPYGYGETLTVLDENGKDTIDGTPVQVVKTRYTTDLAVPQSDVVLTADINQTYYIDTETQQLVRIVTDLTDLNRETQMLNDIMANGVTPDEAEANLKDTPLICCTETLDIRPYGETMTAEQPDMQD